MNKEEYRQKDYAGPWTKLYDRNGNHIGLEELCKYVFFHYHPDIFEEKPEEIVRLRKACMDILKELESDKK